jgi:NAD+ kinase
MFNKIGIISKHCDERVAEALKALILHLKKRCVSLLIDKTSADYLDDQHNLTVVDIEKLGSKCGLVIVVGGDGTLLRAARALAQYNVVRILGINLGHLGFLTDISPDSMVESIDAILGGSYIEEKRFLLHAEVYRDNKCIAESDAFNDVVLHKWNTAHVFSFSTKINDVFVSNQHADGLIISTPTGSTAYALSCGGPIIQPTLNVLLLLFVCPHTLTNRPIVVDSQNDIEITLSSREQTKTTAQMTCDGVLCKELLSGDKIRITKHRHIHLLHPPNYDHYATLRAKFNWGK